MLLHVGYVILSLAAISHGRRYHREECAGRELHYDLFLYSGRCYQFVDQEQDWKDARNYCRKHGGMLVKIEDAATQEFIVDKIKNLLHWRNNGIWIGANDRDWEGRWSWSDGSRVKYTNWGSGQPKSGLGEKDCVQLRRAYSWKWVSRGCSYFYNLSKYRFICSYLPLTSSTTWTTPSAFNLMGKTSSPSTSSTTSHVTSHVTSRVTSSATSHVTSRVKSLTTGMLTSPLLFKSLHAPEVGHVQQVIGSTATSDKRDAKSVITYAAVGLLCLIIGILAVCLIVMRRKRRRDKPAVEVQYVVAPNDVDVTHVMTSAAVSNSLYAEATGAAHAYDEPVCPPPLPCRDLLLSRAVPNPYSMEPAEPLYESLDKLDGTRPTYQPLGPIYQTPRSSEEDLNTPDNEDYLTPSLTSLSTVGETQPAAENHAVQPDSPPVMQAPEPPTLFRSTEELTGDDLDDEKLRLLNYDIPRPHQTGALGKL